MYYVLCMYYKHDMCNAYKYILDKQYIESSAVLKALESTEPLGMCPI